MVKLLSGITISRLSVGILFCTAAISNLSAQTSDNQTTVKENFELNITRERITETDFVRSTEVSLNNDGKSGVTLEVGVGVRAERIDVFLRGITGQVNFRATLAAIKRQLEQRQQPAQPK